MPTTREVYWAKAERQRRRRRHYTRDQVGAECTEGCGLRVPLALIEQGITAHPTCGAQARHEMRAS